MRHVKTIPVTNFRHWSKKENKFFSYYNELKEMIAFNNKKAFLWFKTKYGDKPYLDCNRGIIRVKEGYMMRINPTNIKIYAV